MRQPYPAPARPPVQMQHRMRLPRNPLVLALIGGGAALIILMSTLLAVGFGAVVVFSSGRILPGVSAGGVSLGGLDVEDAVAQLEASWTEITIRDGERSWRVPASQFGLTLDAWETARAAQRYGRSEGSALTGLLGRAQVVPLVRIDAARAAQGIEALAPLVNLPARNATIRMENGELVHVPAEAGRELNAPDTLARLAGVASELADGALDLSMNITYPAVTDAMPLLERTRALLASSLLINAYNPVTDQAVGWAVPADAWGRWLTTENTPSGMTLSLDSGLLGEFLSARHAELGGAQFLKIEEAVRAVQAAVAAGTPNAVVRVYNAPARYTVAPGDTLGTISWKVGIQMFRIQRANPGVNLDYLAPGQVINLPSRDDLLPLPVIPHKRVVVSITQQRVRVYEHGQVKWDWPASTGIASSPTMPGVYQVQSHDGTAYASNWNLWMPHFLSIYEAVPGFYNGFHGFPSRGGSQILWENALGTRVTYGCILVSSVNARLLYEWAEDGVVVEIQP